MADWETFTVGARSTKTTTPEKMSINECVPQHFLANPALLLQALCIVT